MNRIADILFTLVVAVIGFSALAYNAAGAIAPNLVDIPESSNLENRYYAEKPELNMQTLFDEEFQNGLEAYIADHVPQRDPAVLINAELQRASIALAAASMGFDVYPSFFGSRYNVVPKDGLIVDRAEELPENTEALDAWVNTLNDAARNHPDVRFVYDCVARHDQTEFNPTYRYLHDCVNPGWVNDNLLSKLDPRIDSFIDTVESYDELKTEWFATDCHWTLQRALQSYNEVARRLDLKQYAYENPVQVSDAWYGSYALGGLDLDMPITLNDVPIDFSYLTFRYLAEDGGALREMGIREDLLAGKQTQVDGASMYYAYYGGGSAEAQNSADNNGKTMLFVGDSLSYCLARQYASNYRNTVFLLPGNGRYSASLESYIERYKPDDVIVMMHATKYLMFAEYSPAFIGLDS